MKQIELKKYKCPNCKRTSLKTSDVVIVMCPCGYEMEEVNERLY